MARDEAAGANRAILPRDVLPCVWMTAGLVAYKLCDRAYDCEHCPLDAAFRGVAQSAPTGTPPPGAPTWEFPSDRFYHAKHGWVLALGDGRVRCGLDVFAAFLLALPSAVVLPTPRTRLCRGEAGCWIKDDEEVLPLAAPMSGVVVKANQQVQRLPASICGSPYDEGWLLELRPDRDPAGDEGLVTAAAMRAQSDRQMQQLRAEARRHACQDPALGPTLHDGGEIVKELWRILGRTRYHDLVRPLIG